MYYYLGFYFLTIGNLMVESMFETQAGIFFFTIFNGIGIIKKSDKWCSANIVIQFFDSFNGTNNDFEVDDWLTINGIK